ncbi:MAG: hypothetical protein M3Y27_04615 [Acidobacteriota bacterium]|nr:hypothetical protein [Acidobacteriota bacterium]
MTRLTIGFPTSSPKLSLVGSTYVLEPYPKVIREPIQVFSQGPKFVGSTLRAQALTHHVTGILRCLAFMI